MGSFNSAPKINNVDSQDDDVEVPAGLHTNADLVNHCKLMRGDNRPELLQRSFFKPINDPMLHDVTDGLRYLQLNSVSKGKKQNPNSDFDSCSILSGAVFDSRLKFFDSLCSL